MKSLTSGSVKFGSSNKFYSSIQKKIVSGQTSIFTPDELN